jgi:hypothetical protein
VRAGSASARQPPTVSTPHPAFRRIVACALVGAGLAGAAADGPAIASTTAARTDPVATDGSSVPTTYYLDATNGDDADAGTSESGPWQTLAKATAASLEPGDRLLLRRGRRWSGRLELAESGTAAAPITVGAYGTGDRPVVTGDCVVLKGSNVVVQDLQANDCKFTGVDVLGDDNRVEGNLLTHNVAAVYLRTEATRNVVSGNDIIDNAKMSVRTRTPANDDGGAWGVLLHGDSNEIAHNTIAGSDAFSYDTRTHRDGSAIEVYGGRGNTIHHNLGMDNDAFSELGNARSADNTFAYNVVHSSAPWSAFVVTRGGRDHYGPVARTALYNNTAVLTGAGTQGFVCHGGCGPDILIMRNNIIQAVWKVGYADAPFDEDYDLYYGGIRQFAMGAHSVVAAPAFVDPGAWNLRLERTSPAIDRGVRLGYGSDFDEGSASRDGDGDGVAAPDLGAYEYAE